MLTIRDRVFDISSAKLGAIMSLDEDAGWQCKWYFEFETVARKFDDENWHPKLYAESLLISLPGPDALPGQSVQVHDPHNADSEPNFQLYVFEHEPAWDVRIYFGEWHGELIDVTIDAKADVCWDDIYGTAVPIRLHCRVSFEGINVWDRSEESARSRLAALYDPARYFCEKARIGFNYRLRPITG